MSYLGRSAKLSLKAQEKVSFLATAGQTVKTGLSYTVGFIEVYVNGVLLTDTTDFTATNGNSITFTVALLLNDEVTVISLKTFTVADHYSKTEADALLAAKATNTALALKAPIASPVFTGNVGVGVTPSADLHLKSTTSGNPELRLEGSGAENGIITFLGSGHTNPAVGLRYISSGDSIGHLAFYANSSSSSTLTERMRINSAGIVTKPYQPAFQVRGGNTSALPLQTYTLVNFNIETFDQNSDFNTTTKTFTAPVTGKYQFNVQILWVDWDSSANYYYLQLQTSNRTYYELYSGVSRPSDPTYSYGHIHVLADMDAGDIANVKIFQNQGTSQTTYDDQTIFTGHLVC